MGHGYDIHSFQDIMTNIVGTFVVGKHVPTLKEVRASKLKWILDLVVLQSSIEELHDREATSFGDILQEYVILREHAEQVRADTLVHLQKLEVLEKVLSEDQ